MPSLVFVRLRLFTFKRDETPRLGRYTYAVPNGVRMLGRTLKKGDEQKVRVLRKTETV